MHVFYIKNFHTLPIFSGRLIIDFIMFALNTITNPMMFSNKLFSTLW